MYHRLHLPTLLALAAILFSGAPDAAAQDAGGTYQITVSSGGRSAQGTLEVVRGADGGYDLTRSITWADGGQETLHGTATRSAGGWLRAVFPLGPGIVENLRFDRPTAVARPITGTYRITRAGRVWGRLANPDRANGWASASDSGAKSVPSNVTIVAPKPGGRYLAGQVIAVTTQPAGASWSASGPATRTADGRLQFTGAGEVTLTATSGDSASPTVTVMALALQVVEVTVDQAQPIVDAPAPHFSRKLDAAIPTRREPAAILVNQPLQLRVTVQAAEDLTEPAEVKLVGTADGKQLEGVARLSALKNGQAVAVRSTTPLNARVAVNPLVVFWNVECAGLRAEATPTTPLRIYTSYRAAVANIGRGPARLNTKLHFEMACTWANGASRNIGNGADAIVYQVDNQMRHYVHPVDFKREVAVPAYPQGSQPPLNYRDLPGDWSVRSSGERGVSSLYYPPLEPKKPYEHYENFRGNFGWNLLDNPTHTGGRCNQQASLVCDVAGVLGIKASVHYLERTGFGKRSGRPVRQYFYAAGGSGPWNFHGIVKASMDDGSEWLYDGSFSSPPNRLNGKREWAEAPGGPFIQKWGPWYYEDAGGKVADDDIPTKWSGIQ